MFVERDVVMIRSLRKILDEGDFLLKGKFAPGFVKVLDWVQELEKRVKTDLVREIKKPKKVK